MAIRSAVDVSPELAGQRLGADLPSAQVYGENVRVVVPMFAVASIVLKVVY